MIFLEGSIVVAFFTALEQYFLHILYSIIIIVITALFQRIIETLLTLICVIYYRN